MSFFFFLLLFLEMSAGGAEQRLARSARALTTPEVLTVEVAGVVLGLQLRDELGLLPEQAVPVQVVEELVLLHLGGASCACMEAHDNQSVSPNRFRSRAQS